MTRISRLVSFFLCVFLVSSLFLVLIPKGNATTTLGYTSIGGTDDAQDSTYALICHFTTDTAFTATRIWAYIKGAATVSLGIYDGDTLTAPLLIHIEGAKGAGNGWITLAFSSPLTLNASSTYSLGFKGVSSSFSWVYDAGDGGQTHYQGGLAAASTLPNPYNTAGDVARVYSIYVDDVVSGQDLTFTNNENLFPSSTSFFGKELSYLQTGLVLPSDVVSMSKAISGVITEFLSTNTLNPNANLLFNKELAFWKYDNLFNSATSTMTKAIKITLFEIFDFVKLHASTVMLPGWTALTVDIAVAIGVLALVLAICGISLVVLRRRRD